MKRKIIKNIIDDKSIPIAHSVTNIYIQNIIAIDEKIIHISNIK